MEKREQQDLVYQAESKVAKGRTFANIEEVSAFVRSLRELPWWERFYWQVPMIEVEKADGRTHASVGAWLPDRNTGVINMLPEHMNELTVLHEVAHVLASALHGSVSHCPWFCREFLNTAYLVMGSETWQHLRQAFAEGGVCVDC